MSLHANFTLKNELAEKELIKRFRHDNTWLSQVRSKQSWVGNEVIRIPTRGVAPAVLINNKIYPIPKNGDRTATLWSHSTDTTRRTPW